MCLIVSSVVFSLRSVPVISSFICSRLLVLVSVDFNLIDEFLVDEFVLADEH
jgi:hypothetical protein